MSQFVVADINVRSIIRRYAEVEAFSQNKLPSNPLGFTARNMTKNDLWIAATTSILGLTLLTTDQDFRHLDKTYIELKEVDLSNM